MSQKINMDEKRIEALKRLETGFITDALERLEAGAWTWGIYPANPVMKLAGRAFTVKFDYVKPEQNFYKHMMDLYDHYKPGDVLVVAAHVKSAVTGEHVIHAAMNAGYQGYVIDGYVRDYGGIAAYGDKFPTFCCGPSAGRAPNNFKAVAVDIPVTVGGVDVQPADFIVGDIDGVIVIPAGLIDDVIYLAEKVSEIEEKMVKALNEKCPTSVFLELSKEKRSLKKP